MHSMKNMGFPPSSVCRLSTEYYRYAGKKHWVLLLRKGGGRLRIARRQVIL